MSSDKSYIPTWDGAGGAVQKELYLQVEYYCKPVNKMIEDTEFSEAPNATAKPAHRSTTVTSIGFFPQGSLERPFDGDPECESKSDCERQPAFCLNDKCIPLCKNQSDCHTLGESCINTDTGGFPDEND